MAVNYASSRLAAEAVVEEIREFKGGMAVAIQADVSKPEGAKMLLETANQSFEEPVSILVSQLQDFLY